MRWKEFEAQSPELALFGAIRLNDEIAYLATIQRDGSPRVHPVRPFIGEGYLFIFIEETSPKGHDLRRNGRYALHCSVSDTNGPRSEFLITGLAEEVVAPQVREQAVKIVGTAVPDQQRLFEFHVESALAIEYDENRKPLRCRWQKS